MCQCGLGCSCHLVCVSNRMRHQMYGNVASIKPSHIPHEKIYKCYGGSHDPCTCTWTKCYKCLCTCRLCRVRKCKERKRNGIKCTYVPPRKHPIPNKHTIPQPPIVISHAHNHTGKRNSTQHKAIRIHKPYKPNKLVRTTNCNNIICVSSPIRDTPADYVNSKDTLYHCTRFPGIGLILHAMEINRLANLPVVPMFTTI